MPTYTYIDTNRGAAGIQIRSGSVRSRPSQFETKAVEGFVTCLQSWAFKFWISSDQNGWHDGRISVGPRLAL